MGAISFVHAPETVLFAIDLDKETADDTGKGYSRFAAIAHAIATFVTAKKRVCSSHRFGLITLRERAALLPNSITSSEGALLSQLHSLAPGDRSYGTLDLASVVDVASPLAAQEEASGRVLRVLLVYSRSSAPPTLSHAPATPQRGAAAPPLPPPPLARAPPPRRVRLDCVYIHERPQPGANQPQLVYDALEAAVDTLAAASGHAAYIFEASSGQLRKLFNAMAILLVHPLQRPRQQLWQPALDMSVAQLQQLPSAAASTLGSTWQQPLATTSSPGPSYAAAAAAYTGAGAGSAPGVAGGPGLVALLQQQSAPAAVLRQQQQQPQACAAPGGTWGGPGEWQQQLAAPHVAAAVQVAAAAQGAVVGGAGAHTTGSWGGAAGGGGAGISGSGSSAVAVPGIMVDVVVPADYWQPPAEPAEQQQQQQAQLRP